MNLFCFNFLSSIYLRPQTHVGGSTPTYAIYISFPERAVEPALPAVPVQLLVGTLPRGSSVPVPAKSLNASRLLSLSLHVVGHPVHRLLVASPALYYPLVT